MSEDSPTDVEPVVSHGKDAPATKKPRTVIVARNTVWNLTAKGVDFAGNLAASILVARAYGVEGFGQFSFVVAFATLFSMGMDWGLDHIFVREISRRPGDGRLELGNVLGLKFLFLIGLIPIVIIGNQALGMTKGVRTAVYLGIIGIMIFRTGFTRIAEGVFLARDAMSRKALITVIYQVLRLVGVVLVLQSGGGLILLFVALLMTDLFQAIFVGIWVHKRLVPVSLKFNRIQVGFFFAQALPLAISLFCNGTLFQQDILILRHLTDDTQVGLFSSGYRIVMGMVTFITPAFAVLLPEFSRKAVTSNSDVSVLGGKIAQLFLAAVIPGVVLLALIAKPLMVLLYGQPFAVAAPVLQILAAVVFLRSLEFMFDMGLISVNKAWWVFIASFSSLVVNVVLNFLWIPKWGFMGAVYAKLAAEIVVFGLAFMLFQFAVRGSLLPRWILRPLAASVVFIAVMYFAQRLGAFPAYVIGLGAYLVTFSVVARNDLLDLIHIGRSS